MWIFMFQVFVSLLEFATALLWRVRNKRIYDLCRKLMLILQFCGNRLNGIKKNIAIHRGLIKNRLFANI